MLGRPCLGCGVTLESGRRCSACQTAEDAKQHDSLYDAAWRKLAKRIIGDWIREHGPWCPGYGAEHDAHPSFDLTVDHGDQAGVRTALLDRSRLRVMCRSWNAILGRRGVGVALSLRHR